MRGSLEYVGIPKDNFSTAIDSTTGDLKADLAGKGVKLAKVPQMDVTYIAFNMEDPVVKKLGPDFRKAFALAMDEKQLIQLFYNGRGIAAQTPVPPGILGYDETYVNPYVSHNPTRAKELLAKAGYPEGKGLPELVYETAEGTDSRQQAEWIQNQLAAVGIKIRVNANRFSELTEKINQRKAQLWGIAWGADYPDAENFLQLLYSGNAAPGPNGSNFKNAEYDTLYLQMKVMFDSPERRKIINRMKDIFAEQMPWVPNLHRVEFYLNHPWLNNFKFTTIHGSFAKYLRVDPTKKKDAK
jgi:ABC-type transport system substrate-binding protein